MEDTRESKKGRQRKHNEEKEDIDSALNKMLFEGKIMENEKIVIAKNIKELIKKPEVKEWFNSNNMIRTENSLDFL